MASYVPIPPALRICLPDNSAVSGVQQYEIHFKDDAQFRQALAALYACQTSPQSSNRSSPATSPLPSRPPSLSDSNTSSARSSVSLHPYDEAENCAEAIAVIKDRVKDLNVLRNRAEAYSVLDGKRIPPPDRDYGNAHGLGAMFQYWAYQDMQIGVRKAMVANSRPSPTNPIFSWPALHKTLLAQMSFEDQRAFPEAKEDLVATLLFLSPEGGEFKYVRGRVPLQEKSVKFFQGLMVDFMVRDWMDVLWLGRPGEEPPRELLPWEGVKLTWGESML